MVQKVQKSLKKKSMRHWVKRPLEHRNQDKTLSKKFKLFASYNEKTQISIESGRHAEKKIAQIAEIGVKLKMSSLFRLFLNMVRETGKWFPNMSMKGRLSNVGSDGLKL